ncbi:MAG TPA: molybdopterin dinucleotide binding domain-containing protein, partial [Roseiflexaceae bacterium]|nr:molybdopterin dinucleotide binding domain-containing protein [Roseiflexaceae bacterium]
FWLTTGRVLEQWHSRTRTGQVAKLNQKEHGSYVVIHPDDAAQLGIADGELVNLHSRRGGCAAVARLSKDILRGVLFMPIHWQDGNPNWATSPILDPTSKQPELKACAVWLARSSDLLELGATLETGERVATESAGW